MSDSEQFTWDDAFARFGTAMLSDEPDEWVVSRSSLLAGSARLFDAGCGTGRHLGLLGELGARVAAVDGSSAALAIAKSRLGSARDSRYDFQHKDLSSESPAGTMSEFNGGICIDVLSVAERPLTVLQNLRRLTKPGGRLLVSANGAQDEMFRDGNLSGAMSCIIGGLQYRGFDQLQLHNLSLDAGWSVEAMEERTYVDEPHAHRPRRHTHHVIYAVLTVTERPSESRVSLPAQ